MLVAVLAIGAVVAALGIALFGYYQTKVAPKGATVLRVEDRSFNLRYFERRARYEIRNNNTALLTDATTAVDTLLFMVEREELIRRGAPEEGVVVTDEDVDQAIGRRLNLATGVDRATFTDAYRDAVHDSGLSTTDYRDLFAASTAESQLRQKFQEDVAPTAEQVRYRIIVVATPEEARAVLDRFNTGEDFAALVAEFSTDAASKPKGGEKPWAARGELEPALDEVLFTMQPGQRPRLVETQANAVLVELLERQAEREITPEQRVVLGGRAFDDWLQALRDRTRILTFLEQEQENAILTALAEEANRRA